MPKVTRQLILVFASLILFSILLSCENSSSSEYQPISFGSLEMMARGNCIPRNLQEVVIDSTILVSNEEICSLDYISLTEIISVSNYGNVFLTDINTKISNQISQLGPGQWRIKSIDQHSYMLIGPGHTNIDQQIERDWLYMDSNGELLWSLYKFSDGDLVFYDHDVIYMSEGPSGGAALYNISDEGESGLLKEFDIPTSGIQYILPTRYGILWLGFKQGPYLTNKFGQEYDIQLWHNDWNEGAFKVVLDPEGRLYELHDGGESLLILDSNKDSALLIPYLEINNLDYRDPRDSWGTNAHLATNGIKTFILYSKYLIQYSDSEFEIIIDNFDKFGSEFWASGLYIDSSGTKFIIPLKSTILVCDISGSIDEIKFNDDINTFRFSANFEYLAIGTANGEIHILNLASDQ